MRNRLTIAEVNCEDYSSLCKAQDVPGYPSLFFYTGGGGKGLHKTDYAGGRKFEQLRQFAEMAISP
jgi:protein disulfide-isomerase